MDYIFDALVDPIEINETFCQDIDHEFTSENFPDFFRKKLFNSEKKIKFINDAKSMAKITKTKEKYWHDNFDIVGEITKKICEINKLPKHSFMDFVKYKSKLSIHLMNHYKTIYDIADIIITKSTNTNRTNLIRATKYVLDIEECPFRARIAMYLYVHLLDFLSSNQYQNSKNTIACKAKEFKLGSNINGCFVMEELDNYLKYLDEHTLQ
jgi:hypothetical protein